MNLIKYDAAIHALAECKAFDEVKSWSDKAAAMQAYGRMAKDKTLEIDAAEIRIRAERRLGELISLQKLGDGLNKGGRPVELTGTHKVPVSNPTLSDVGISKNLSSRAQKLAAVPADEFESEVSDWRERVGQENARVSARLEKRGEQEIIKRKEDQGSEYDSFDESSIEAEIKGEFDPVAELELALVQIDDLNKEIDRLNKIIESNDHLAELKKLSDINQVLESQKNGYLVSLNDQKSYSKMWKAKFEKLEKSVKASGLVEF